MIELYMFCIIDNHMSIVESISNKDMMHLS